MEQPRRRRLESGEVTKPGEAAKPGEEARLLAHATSPLMRDLIIAGVDTGCRPGELLGLQCQHVKQSWCLPGSVTKTGKDRDVPYAPKGRLAGPTGDAASRPGGGAAATDRSRVR